VNLALSDTQADRLIGLHQHGPWRDNWLPADNVDGRETAVYVSLVQLGLADWFGNAVSGLGQFRITAAGREVAIPLMAKQEAEYNAAVVRDELPRLRQAAQSYANLTCALGIVGFFVGVPLVLGIIGGVLNGVLRLMGLWP
jgi:hypothetical protein